MTSSQLKFLKKRLELGGLSVGNKLVTSTILSIVFKTPSHKRSLKSWKKLNLLEKKYIVTNQAWYISIFRVWKISKDQHQKLRIINSKIK